MKLYTKTGDKGQTGLIGGTRVPKTDLRLEAYGTIDELNSFIGLLVSQLSTEKHIKTLRIIQNKLFSVGSHLATDTTKTDFLSASIISDADCRFLEVEMDNLMENLPPLNAFVIPGSVQTNATCHICRTITRRAERRILELKDLYKIDIQILIYINRLSDYFFALSRQLTFENDVEENCWKPQD